MPALAAPPLSARLERLPSEDSDGRPTLEEVLGSACESLHAGLCATCAVCGGRMEPEPGGGRCHGCGSRLS